MSGALPIAETQVVTVFPATVSGVRCLHAVASKNAAALNIRFRDGTATGSILWTSVAPLGYQREDLGSIQVPTGTLYIEKAGLGAVNDVSIAITKRSALTSETGLS